MNRRSFVSAAVLGVLAAPLAAGAQQTRKAVPRIAFLSTTSPEDSPNPVVEGFRLGLHDLGYVEGQSVAIEWRWGRGRIDRFPEFAAEIVRLKVDVIVAANTPAGRAAQMATKTIPIVIPFMSDLVGDGFAASLAHPGGNITGLTNEGPEIASKRLQVFKEALPNLFRIAVLADTSEGSYRQTMSNVETAARALGVRVQTRHEVGSQRELDPAFAAITRDGVGAVFVVSGTMTFANRAQLADLALKSRLPLLSTKPG